MSLSCFTYIVGVFRMFNVVGPSVVGRGASVVLLKDKAF